MDWIFSSGLRILSIIIVALVSFVILKATIPLAVKSQVNRRGRGRHADSWFQQRIDTINRIAAAAAAIVIAIIAASMILSEVGIDIGPLLVGAGIAGVAIGFGAQSIIKDFLSGLFITLEDQFNVGDVIKVGRIGGQVEEFTLRRTVLRDLGGIVHSIPNGSITKVSNFTRDYARVKLDVPVAYGEDLDHVIEVINRVGNELANDKGFKKSIKTPPQVLRVENFGDSGIEIRVLGDTYPLKQWKVTGELRKRLKQAFDQEGIEIPRPHIKLYFSDEQLEKYFKEKQ